MTHTGPQLNNRPFDQLMQFLRINIRIREELQISDLNRIGNCDETQLWFNMVENTSIEKIGNKDSNLKLLETKNQEYIVYYVLKLGE